VAAFQASGGGEGGQALYDLAASLELIHAYSLMHDDLPCMDDADLRRGRPTTHRVHGVSTTTVAGTALIPLAVRHAWVSARALGCEPAQAGEVARTLARAAGAGGMVGGQALDLLGEERRLAGEELDKLHRLKTGALLTAALRMGSLAAGAPERVRTGLEAFGDHIGLAFQIADDILDATSSAEELGKNPSDEELGKSTYVSLHGLGSARARGEREVEQARSALARAQVVSPALDALARYVLERRR
jgi:geranylgeranyl pyrophosphate synthase